MAEQKLKNVTRIKSIFAYHQHKNRLFSYGLYLSGDKQLAEDTVHDVFVKYLESAEQFESDNNLANWLFICARNLLLNRLAKEKQTSNYDFSTLAIQPAVEHKLFIDKILARLTPEEKDLLLLREQQGFSIRELAQMLEMTEETIRVRLFRIRKKIHEMKASLL